MKVWVIYIVQKYVSEIIGEEYKEWKKGDKILIKSPTGSGKSNFILEQIVNWCRCKNRKQLLILSNRTLLNKQQQSELRNRLYGEKDNYFPLSEADFALYQNFSGDAFVFYDVIVCDESHYFFQDSSFNRNTDTIYKHVINYTDGIVIFLSATPQLLEHRLKDLITKIYSLPSGIKNYNLFRFWESNAVPDIIRNIRGEHPGEKIIYFSNKNAYKVHEKFDNSAFICSDGNEKKRQYVDRKEKTNIVQNSYFHSNLLCTTTVLDNGVNIKDKAVKHIIIDVFSPISAIQCLGRKRLESEDEEINIYIKDYSEKELQYLLKNAINHLTPAIEYETLSNESFAQQYNKKAIPDILDLVSFGEEAFKFEVNECMRD